MLAGRKSRVMKLPAHKTKIVATIGPASRSPEMLRRLIRAGMNIARLNFSHADFSEHANNIRRIREAAKEVGSRVAIMADLPGPKMRLGELPGGPYELEIGDPFTLVGEECEGDARRASTTFERLPDVVRKGDRIFLNDGLVQLIVDEVSRRNVRTTVAVGGRISSRKGLNLPRIDLGIDAFTPRDHECMQFALKNGVDAVSQSFVESADDIRKVKRAAAALGYHPFVIAKIERQEAVDRYEGILQAADGIMVARGDLGVEVPIEGMAATQKRLIAAANLVGKPVITATQMLESMIVSRLPTRAEATDVANAILDGTDCVMLSGESAMGAYPEEAVAMLGRIASSAERYRQEAGLHVQWKESGTGKVSPRAFVVENALAMTRCEAVLVPTRSGKTARSVARWRSPAWILAVGTDPAAMQTLAFSHGVHPIDIESEPENWNAFAAEKIAYLGIRAQTVLLVAGPSRHNPNANHRIELIELAACRT
jgi:pyruvate kinase